MRRGGLPVAAAVVLLAAALRLWGLGRAPPNPFYDAAVRSMGQSWHNFFFGAIDPVGAVSIDKPPADLWLQVLSTKLLGFDTFTLHIPEALGGSVAVALLYVTVRSVWGHRAGILAALSLAVLPVSVLTARSDTMDSVMTALLVASLWASVRALETRRGVWVPAAAALIGLAFNVKLAEALVPLPGLAAMWWMAAARRRRAPVLIGATVALVVVGMAWIVVASFTPVSGRPYPTGSGTGSIYRVVFQYNGLDRLRGSPQLGPIDPTPPGPLRLVGSRSDYSHLIGTEIIGAVTLALGLGLVKARRRRRGRTGAVEPSGPDSPLPPPGLTSSVTTAGDPTPGRARPEDVRDRVARWTSVGLGAWLLAALALFSTIGHLQTRYLEAGTPALAATLGVSAAVLIARSSQGGGALGALAGALALSGVYGVAMATDLLGGAAAGLGLAVALVLAGLAGRRARHRDAVHRRWTGTGGLTVVVALALLAAPVRASVDLVDRNASDAPQAGSGSEYAAYLHAHRHGTQYEVASSQPLGVVGLIAADGQPVLILNDVKGPLVHLASLKALVRRGAVRYVLLTHPCTGGLPCPPTTSWSLRHAVRIRGYLYGYDDGGRASRTRAGT